MIHTAEERSGWGETGKEQSVLNALPLESIGFLARCGGKEEALEELSFLAWRGGCVTDRAELLKDMKRRESLEGTGVGEGIAIPHARTAGVQSPCMAALVLQGDLAFDSWDGQPVRLLFLIATPEEQISRHLQLLSRLAAVLLIPKISERLLHSQGPEDFRAWLWRAEMQILWEEEKKRAEKPLFPLRVYG